jgi:hypothetical protein
VQSTSAVNAGAEFGRLRAWLGERMRAGASPVSVGLELLEEVGRA